MLSPRRTAQLGLASAVLVLTVGMGVLTMNAIDNYRALNVIPGTSVPDVKFNDLQGRAVELSSLQGKVTVLYFTSLDSTLSSKYMPRVMNWARDWSQSDSPVNILAVHDARDAAHPAGVREIRVQDVVWGQTFPSFVDISGKAARGFEVQERPTFFVIDANGTLRYRGPFDDNVDATQVKCHYVADAVRKLVTPTTYSLATLASEKE